MTSRITYRGQASGMRRHKSLQHSFGEAEGELLTDTQTKGEAVILIAQIILFATLPNLSCPSYL